MNIDFSILRQSISQLSTSFKQSAMADINSHLTLRNWLIGYYIVEFEQKGKDRAKYGAKLLQNLAEELNEDGLSYRNLRLYRQFYISYPQVGSYLPVFFQKNTQIGQPVSVQLQLLENSGTTLQNIPEKKPRIANNQGDTIWHSVSAKSNRDNLPLIPAEKLLYKLSFTHIKLLLPITDPLKRLFYEIECIKGTWSVRELKRQIYTGAARKRAAYTIYTRRICQRKLLTYTLIPDYLYQSYVKGEAL
jgi:hypothetical protein